MGVGFIWFLGGHRLTAIRRGATAALPRVLEQQRWRRVFGFSCCRREAKGGGGFLGFPAAANFLNRLPPPVARCLKPAYFALLPQIF
jgi:hypothetical protein